MSLDTARADRWTGIVLFGIGAAMLVGGFTMDRLEIRRIHPASIPGLVPMILGVAMMICSALLVASAGRREAALEAESGHASDGSLRALGFAALYSVVYALLLVGTLPFVVATALYVAVFYIHFSWKPGHPLAAQLPVIGLGVLFGVAGSYAIASLFQYGFLVRLP